MANNSYWIVCAKGDPDKIGGDVRSAVNHLLQPGEAVSDFNVPQGALAPKFGSFDNLIRLYDDLHKFDSQTEASLRRIERQWLEVDDQAVFEVLQGQQKQPVSVGNFLKAGWQWDEAKYSSQKSLQANLDFLLDRAGKIDEDCRSKGQTYNDIKAQKASLTKRDGVSFPTRDLVDLLTPDVVVPSDFHETDHLTTVIVILTRGQEKEFLAWYQEPSFTTVKMDKEGNEVKTTESIAPPQTVIPDSAQKFTSFPEGAEDKDGNTVWRVVLFKSCKEKFALLARQNKFIVRDFTYDGSKCAELNKKREAIEIECDKHLSTLTNFCKMAWSDVFTAWLHIKAMRCYVECVLRFGGEHNTKFSGFLLCPKVGSSEPLRKVLASIPSLSPGGAVEADGEDYFPYISVSFAPRAAQLSA